MRPGHLLDECCGAYRLADAEWAALNVGLITSTAATDCADARLQRVRAAIEAGTFHASAHNIARRLLEQLLAS